MEQDYKDLKNCELCHKKFGLTKRPHKCKRCKLIICSDCGKTKAIIINTKDHPEVPHRVCHVCSTDINSQKEIRDTYNVAWATLSPLGREWVKDCNIQQEISLNIQTDYAKNLKESELNVDPAQLIFDLKDGKADREFFNYSMLEFLFALQQGKEREAIRKNVENVLMAFYNRYRKNQQTHVTALIGVVVFLLCFTDEQNAFGLLCYINEKLAPKGFWNKNSSPLPLEGIHKEAYFLKKLATEALYPDTTGENLTPFKIIFRKTSSTLIGSLMVDIVNFNTILYVWTQMFTQKSLIPLESSIIKVFKLSRPYYVVHYNLSLYNFRVWVCRNIQASSLRDDYTVQITESQRQAVAQEFNEKILNQLCDNYENLSSTLQILKELTMNDVDVMKDRIQDLARPSKTSKKQAISFVEMTQPTFISVLKEASSLRGLEESNLKMIFQTLDIDKLGYISSKVFIGLLGFLTPPTLTQKLEKIFNQFDSGSHKTLPAKEVPAVILLIGEILAILNEADPENLNFNVDLYEMIEKVKKKLKTMDKVTLQDFESITSKFNVFQVISGEKSTPRKRTNSVVSFVSMNDSVSVKGTNDSLSFEKSPEDDSNTNEQNFNILTNDVISPIKKEETNFDNLREKEELKRDQSFEVVKEEGSKGSKGSKGQKSSGGSQIDFDEPEPQQNVIVAKKIEESPPRLQAHASGQANENIVPAVSPNTIKAANNEKEKTFTTPASTGVYTLPEVKLREEPKLMVDTRVNINAAAEASGQQKSSGDVPQRTGQIIDYDTESDTEGVQTSQSKAIKTTLNTKDASKKQEVESKEQSSQCQICNIF